MSLFTIDQLFTAPTAAAFRAQMVTNLVALGIPADKWRAGGVASTMLTVASMSLALLAAIVATIVQGLFLPTASGGGLKLLAQYVYGVTVPEATFASGTIVLINAGGLFVKNAGEVTVQNPDTGVTYTNATGFTLNPASTLAVTFTATTEGSAGNANPGTITTLVTSMIGVTVSNPVAFVGIDAPNDDSIRSLCRAALGIRSVRGVRSAYAYAIRTATNPVTGNPVNINRWSIAADSTKGTVSIFIASPSGAPSADDVTGVEDNIELLARPEAVDVTVQGVTTTPYSPNISFFCTVPAGVTAAQVQTAAADAITKYIATYPIGGITANDDANPTSSFTGLFGSGVTASAGAAIAATGAVVLSTLGATDLALLPAQVATDSVTVAIRVVTPTAGSF